MPAPIIRPLRLLPPLQDLLLPDQLENLHHQLPTTLLHPPRTIPPEPPHTQIATRTRTQRHQHIDLGEKLDIIPRLGRARGHEIPILGVQPRDLEQVDDVVHVGLVEPEGQHRPRQVRVAVEVEVLARQQLVDVRVAPRAEEVVHAGPRVGVGVRGFPVAKRVRDDREHWAEVGQARP